MLLRSSAIYVTLPIRRIPSSLARIGWRFSTLVNRRRPAEQCRPPTVRSLTRRAVFHAIYCRRRRVLKGHPGPVWSIGTSQETNGGPGCAPFWYSLTGARITILARTPRSLIGGWDRRK